MQKKLYYQLSDGMDVSKIVMGLSGVVAWIEGDMEGKTEEETEDYEYTITPVWMTEEEFKNLPEAEL